MKPSFALDFRHDGISLLHRVKSGWHRVGDVALTSDDLTGEMAMLHRTAADLSQSGVSAKLILPNSQLLYRTLPDPGATDDQRQAAIEAALDGATPYALDELAYDWQAEGGNLYVVAVARETLDEAESFAAEHRFNPVSFVARPDDDAFPGEPFLGAADSGARLIPEGDTLERDTSPVPEARGLSAPPTAMPVVDVPDPVAAEVPEPEPETLATEGPIDAEPDTVEPANEPKAAPEAVAADTDDVDDTIATADAPSDAEAAPTLAADPDALEAETDDKISADTPPELEAEAEAEAEAEELIVDAAPVQADESPEDPAQDGDLSATESSEPEPLPESESESENEPAPKMAAPEPEDVPEAPFAEVDDSEDSGAGAFVSRRIVPPDLSIPPRLSATPSRFGFEGNAPTLGSALRAAETTHMKITAGTVAGDDPEPAPPPPTDPTVSGAVLGSAGRKARKSRIKSGPLPEPPPMPSTRFSSVATPAPSAGGSVQAAAAVVTPVSAPEMVPPLSLTSTPAAADQPWRARQPSLPPAGVAASGKTSADTLRSEDEAASLTVFGARRKPRTEGKPRYLGLILTLILVVSLGLLAWGSGLLPERSTQSAGPGPNAEVFSPDALMPQSGSDEGTLLPQEDQRAADAGIDPEAEADLAGEETELAALAPALLPESEAEPDSEAPADAEPQQPDAQAPANETAEDTTTLSPEELATRYAATGIWPVSPEPAPLISPPDRTDDIYIASIDPSIAQQDAVALPAAPQVERGDVAPASPSPPAPAGTTFDMDDRGLVRATPDGALTPDGAVVYQGRPPVVTAPRPADAEEALASEAAGVTASASAARLEGFSPRIRPGGLIEQNERASLGGLTRAEMAQLRPQARPDSIVARAEETPDATPETGDDAALAAAAAAAAEAASTAFSAPVEPIRISSALVAARPSARPGDFAQTVARAQAAAAARAPADVGTTEGTGDTGAVAAAAAPRAPAIPTTASVARQATVSNAINLNRLNLIGVYGSSNQRRALVRLPSGRYVKVKVGDSIDGGRVRTIGTNTLIYNKRGRDHQIEVAG